MRIKYGNLVTPVALGIMFGLAGYALSAELGSETPKLDAIFGVLLGTISSVLISQAQHAGELSKLGTDILRATDLAKRAMLATSVNSNLARQMRALSRLPPMVQTTALVALQQAIDAFDFNFNEESAYIRGRRLAIKSYAKFWESVKDGIARHDRTIIARMTHSIDIDILYDGVGQEIDAYNRLFANKNGQLFRILLDRERPEPNRISRYVSTIEHMESVGVTCAYLNIFDDGFTKLDFEKIEFCIISEMKITAEWRLRNAREVKALIVGTEPDRYGRHLIRWEAIVDKLLKSNYDFVTDDKEKLVRFRNSFRKKYAPYRKERHSLEFVAE